jgi:hypothetical protein|tara:strand:+ start:80 stop:409 length:330 start_codon:yes stop_codon:yes gene_type:complete
MDLSKDDYAKILEYYKLNPKSYQKDKLQKKAEELLATKLCRCIKNVRKDSKNKFTEQEAIAICRNSVIKKKRLRNFGFTCKKRAKFVPQKGSSKNLVKIKKSKTRRNKK